MRRKFRTTGVETVIVDDDQVVIEGRKPRRGSPPPSKVIPIGAITSVRSEHSSAGVRTLRIITQAGERVIVKMKATIADDAVDVIRRAI